MVFEGIVIGKTPYKERDLIVKVLLRSGFLASFYVYGGQGGGKHHKPSLFEFGSMMRIHIKEQGGRGVEKTELLTVSEYERIWEPSAIRHNVKAFYLSCLYYEIILKFVVTYHPEHGNLDQEHEGIFSVLSNALFYLDKSLASNTFEAHQHLHLFMVKLLYHLGIMPDTDYCVYCGEDLISSPGVHFLIAEGQFSCLGCVQENNDMGFLLRIKKAYQTKYQQMSEVHGTNFNETEKLLNYFCHHFHVKMVELKSYQLIF